MSAETAGKQAPSRVKWQVVNFITGGWEGTIPSRAEEAGWPDSGSNTGGGRGEMTGHRLLRWEREEEGG